MKEIIKKIELKQVSLFLIALPYLAFNFENIIHSPFYSLYKTILIFLFILLIDVLINLGLLKLNEKSKMSISLFILFMSILFFYGPYISNFIQKEFKENFNILIRGRAIIKFSIILFILLFLILKKRIIYFKNFNVFLIIYSVINFFVTIINTKEKIKEEYKSSFISIPIKNYVFKPILLIISDEYTSPDDLNRIFKDTSTYQFSNELASKGWIVKNSIYSYEISTIHSLSSLFNFNLSKNKEYKKEGIEIIGANQLLHANIADSLKKKEVEIINFGIFHIGKSSYLNRIYFYPNSFIEDILKQTIYYTIKNNTGNLNKNGFDNSYYPMETHNKYIFKHLVDTLNTLTNHKTFTYIHFFMPHSPMQYLPDFPIRTQNNIVNYKAYWDFTNKKLNTLLTDLIRENKYRIILTGDHGYRNDKRINPHYTFSAFYGFNQEAIDEIQSVQDLGSLIYGGY